MKSIKKLISCALCLALLFVMVFPAYAAETPEQQIEYFADGSYVVTVIEDEDSGIMPLSTNTAKKSKTTTYSSPSGKALWYVKVTGTFTYGDGSSKCTASSVSAGTYVSAWKISSKSASRSGNKASATATAVETLLPSGETNTVTRTVTLKCSPTGTFS